ncbi:hypothetical protein [Deinococcus hopiensis]|uniref:Uncharacterized protein n=1 Tax=Deinococcus hopiensis KR-140 TaxID=695939 RepID=A0A1W1V6T1_9DEIO|nr:hypothetical protein [Deinococcus hopiensis]SMB89117.1 hypothetical protein SAMN00790413_00276 [Deinococcus hopiensis KR-140]
MNKAEKIVQIQKEVERLSLSARGIARGTALTPNTVLGVLRGEEKVQEATVNLIWFFLGLDHDCTPTKVGQSVPA